MKPLLDFVVPANFHAPEEMQAAWLTENGSLDGLNAAIGDAALEVVLSWPYQDQVGDTLESLMDCLTGVPRDIEYAGVRLYELLLMEMLDAWARRSDGPLPAPVREYYEWLYGEVYVP